MIDPTVIRTATNAHNVQTVEEYRAYIDGRFDRLRAKRPHDVYPRRHPSDAAPKLGPLVEWGTWKIACATPGCSNWPVYHPELQLVICPDCGAEYGDLAIPEPLRLTRFISEPDGREIVEAVGPELTRDELEAALLRLPMKFRNWIPAKYFDDPVAKAVVNGRVI